MEEGTATGMDNHATVLLFGLQDPKNPTMLEVCCVLLTSIC
jgi:hypothetical protein